MRCSNYPNEAPLCYACQVAAKPFGKYVYGGWGKPITPAPNCLINQCVAAMKNVIHVAQYKQRNPPEPGSSEAKREQLTPDERLRKFLIVAVCRKDPIYQRCLRHALEENYPDYLVWFDKLLVLR